MLFEGLSLPPTFLDLFSFFSAIVNLVLTMKPPARHGILFPRLIVLLPLFSWAGETLNPPSSFFSFSFPSNRTYTFRLCYSPMRSRGRLATTPSPVPLFPKRATPFFLCFFSSPLILFFSKSRDSPSDRPALTKCAPACVFSSLSEVRCVSHLFFMLLPSSVPFFFFFVRVQRTSAKSTRNLEPFAGPSPPFFRRFSPLFQPF